MNRLECGGDTASLTIDMEQNRIQGITIKWPSFMGPTENSYVGLVKNGQTDCIYTYVNIGI
jgi:hypothetical protein